MKMSTILHVIDIHLDGKILKRQIRVKKKGARDLFIIMTRDT